MMAYKYEQITQDEGLPIKMIIHTSNEPDFVPKHWHDSLEISYVLSGHIDYIYVEGKEYSPKQGDVVLINSNAIHSFWLDQSVDRKAISLFIPYEFMKINYPNIEQIEFDCLSLTKSGFEKRQEFERLCCTLDSIVRLYEEKEADALGQIQIKKLIYELLFLLLTHFSKKKEYAGVIQSRKYLDRLTTMTSFIKAHYNESLSIENIADQFGFTPEYFSSFFKKHMGITVLNYINTIRIENAHRELLSSDKTNIQIALDHGFPNEKSFIRVFKSIYQMTPNQYKKLIKDKN